MPPTAAGAYQSLQDASKNATTPDAAITAGETKYGTSGLATQLDQLRGLTSNLTTAIGNVAPSVAGRTSGSLVTEAQRNAITNNETQPLTEQLTKVGAQQADVGSRYQDAEGLASNYANSLLTNDKNNYDRLFGQYTALSGQETAASSAAEQKREFDANLAQSKASTASLAGVGSGGGNDDSTTKTAAPNLPQFSKGTTPQSAVAAAFQGYQPGAKPGYTEQVVLPAIERLLTMNNPKQPADVIQGAARNLVYNYRKSAFGE